MTQTVTQVRLVDDPLQLLSHSRLNVQVKDIIQQARTASVETTKKQQKGFYPWQKSWSIYKSAVDMKTSDLC